MAELFLARAQDGALCVLKQLNVADAGDATRVELFLNEARLQLSTGHENIVAVHALSYQDERFTLALEYVAGPDLRALSSRTRLSLGAALYVADCVLAGLAHVAARVPGFVHRDISPENVLVDSETGAVKLTDFGVARFELGSRRTRTGVIRGKVRYMAPEQADGGAIDARCDVFAVGAVLYELVGGQPLYASSDDADAIEQARQGRYIPLGPEQAPEQIRAFVDRALAFAPDERFSGAREMRRALKPHLTVDVGAVQQELARAARSAWQAPAAAQAIPRRWRVPALFASALGAIASYIAVASFSTADVAAPPVRLAPALATSMPVAPLPAQGFLSISADPWAYVYLDASPERQLTPLRAWPIAPGAHHVKLVHPRFGVFERMIHVEAGQETTVLHGFERRKQAP